MDTLISFFRIIDRLTVNNFTVLEWNRYLAELDDYIGPISATRYAYQKELREGIQEAREKLKETENKMTSEETHEILTS